MALLGKDVGATDLATHGWTVNAACSVMSLYGLQTVRLSTQGILGKAEPSTEAETGLQRVWGMGVKWLPTYTRGISLW